MIKRIAVLTIPVLAALAVAGPAGATTATASLSLPLGTTAPTYSTYEVGYGATHADFSSVTMTTQLRSDVGAYSSSYQPYAELYNAANNPEVELIPTSNSATPVNSWNPNADNAPANVTAFKWHQGKPYPATSACYGNTDTRGCFYAGETVTLTVSYDKRTDQATMSVADKANGDEYSAYLDFTTAPGALPSVDVGDVWLQGFYSTPFSQAPATLAPVSSVVLANTAGLRAPMAFWSHFKEIMTSNGKSTGAVEGTPGDLSWLGSNFTVNLK